MCFVNCNRCDLSTPRNLCLRQKMSDYEMATYSKWLMISSLALFFPQSCFGSFCVHPRAGVSKYYGFSGCELVQDPAAACHVSSQHGSLISTVISTVVKSWEPLQAAQGWPEGNILRRHSAKFPTMGQQSGYMFAINCISLTFLDVSQLEVWLWGKWVFEC